MATQNQTATEEKRSNADLWLRSAIRLPLVVLFIGTPLFLGAGTLDWPRAWIFLALLGVTFAANLVLMISLRPTLVRERWKKRTDTKKFDKIFGLAYVLSLLAMFVLAGMDSVRYEWTAMSWSLLYVGLGLHLLGTVPTLWAMFANPHLETTVRIQNDRDHKVIAEGPYRYVRHPMYVGVILMFFGWALILGSWVALGLAAFIMLLFFIRTALEDRTLRSELAGYAEFCEKTRYRLVPGVW